MKKSETTKSPKRRRPRFIISKELNKYSGQILNPEKHKQANEILSRLIKEDPEGWRKFMEDK